MLLPGHNRERTRADRAYRVDGPVGLLIGQGEMPVQCARLLAAAGFDVAAVHSPDAPLRVWGHQQPHTTVFDDFAAFRAWAETLAYDYLFSITNFTLLPLSLLESPLELAINYHDAPLPKYAGSHATAWALTNGEPTHGVSWHVMTEKVDAGDLLKQVTFPIAPGTTKLQLDQRCAMAAIRAFRTLLDELKTETHTRTPQDLRQRTFYSRANPPAAQ